MRITRTTPAKINLFLKIVGRQPDGYHLLQTLFLPLPEIADTITLQEAAPGITLQCDNASVPTDTANLCWRAASQWASCCGRQPAWHISLNKRIPVAAGLGGGSSDAAATLLALQQLYANPLDSTQLHALAARIGADVPFFLDPRPALATGIGDKLQPLHMPTELKLLVVYPRFPVSAAWAYRHWRADCQIHDPWTLSAAMLALRQNEPATIATAVSNDLQAAVWTKFPLLQLIAYRLKAWGCLSCSISGSGPSMFAICPPASQSTIAQAITAEFAPMLQVFACTTVATP